MFIPFTMPRAFAAAAILIAAFSAAYAQEVAPPAGNGASSEIDIEIVRTKWQRHFTIPSLNAGPNYRSSRRFYAYETEFRNETGRKIVAMAWIHSFMSPTTGEILRRFGFAAKQKIDNGKTSKVRRTSMLGPSGKINVQDLKKDESEAYDERIDIRCVWFEDGTLWRSSKHPSSDCRETSRKNAPKRRP